MAFSVSTYVLLRGDQQFFTNSPTVGPQELVAKKQIPQGTIFTKANMGTYWMMASVPNAYAVEGGYSSVASALQGIVGKEAAVTINQGAQGMPGLFTNAMLVHVPYGSQLFSFPITWQQIAGGIVLPGDIVTIMGTSSTGTTMLADNVPVEEVQDNNGVPITKNSWVATSEGNARPQPTLLTVYATPSQMNAIEQAQSNGKLFVTKTQG